MDRNCNKPSNEWVEQIILHREGSRVGQAGESSVQPAEKTDEEEDEGCLAPDISASRRALFSLEKAEDDNGKLTDLALRLMM